jgi:trk system potassium uptake protein
MRRTLTVVHALGLMLAVFSLTYLMPIAASLLYHDGTAIDFIYAMLATATIGVALWSVSYRHRGELSIRHGYLLVVAMWTAMPAVATLPLMLVLPNLSFTDAYFECMSGLTTTGATVLTGLDFLPPALNIWRHELNWLGGLGIIVLAVAILPLLGIGGRQLFKAETPGPMKEAGLTPRIAETARNLWLVYVGITAICILALKLAGMRWLDAVCHAFSAMGLGGFSTHDASIGYFNSPLIEAVLMVFMLLAVMNFATHFTALRARTLRVYVSDAEAMPTLFIVLLSCLGIALFLYWQGVYSDFFLALRHASFNLISIATSSGFASVDYAQWPIFAPLWMMLLTATVASAGSTGGGIKMIRSIILFKQAGREFLKLLHPNAVNPMKISGQVISNNVVFSVLGFIFLYFMCIATLTFLLLISGLDYISAFTAVLASINNCGPGLGIVGPANNYQSLSDFQTWVCTVAMLVGRLEIFTVLILFTPHFWRR